jgi:hypothetical protein
MTPLQAPADHSVEIRPNLPSRAAIGSMHISIGKISGAYPVVARHASLVPAERP